ncbi:unnamed protein product [Caenorhabditis brenneri]
MPIPILKIPDLARINVMDCMENVELLAMSLCNRRVERATRECRVIPSVFFADSEEMRRFNDLEKFRLLQLEAGKSSTKVKLDDGKTSLEVVVSDVISLEFHVGRPIQFIIRINETAQMNDFEGYKKVLNLDGTDVHFMLNNQLHTFWDDRVQGLQFFVEYFETNFCFKKFYWVFENSVPELKPLVAYLNSLPTESEDGLGVEKVTVASWAKLSHPDYKLILETVPHKLKAEMAVSDFRFFGQYSTKNLNLKSAIWFTWEHLLYCNCEYVKVKDSKIDIINLREFLRHWSNGELSHFKKVTVQMEKINLKGLDERNLFVLLRGINVIGEMPKRYSPRRRTMIQNKNGEQATVYCQDQKFVFEKS